MKVLVTAGGTEEPLDGVRRLSNTSTGATGLHIAQTFSDLGAAVYLLHAGRVDAGAVAAESQPYTTFDDLATALERTLGEHHFDAVIHLAAVSDYRLDSIELDGQAVPAGGRGKIGSGHELVLKLVPNPKLIDQLRSWSKNPHLTVIGFKLTDDPDPAARRARVDALLDRGVADLVVHNDIREIDRERHLARIYSRDGTALDTTDKNELARTLFTLLCRGDH